MNPHNVEPYGESWRQPESAMGKVSAMRAYSGGREALARMQRRYGLTGTKRIAERCCANPACSTTGTTAVDPGRWDSRQTGMVGPSTPRR